jgi:hypothetical protein
MPNEIPQVNSQTQDLPPNGSIWIVLAWLAGMVVLAIVLAESAMDDGSTYFFAVLYGAAGATAIVLGALSVYWAIRRDRWRRERGFPFQVADAVEVTSGPYCGRRGKIESYDQGEFYFHVTLDGDESRTEPAWFRVTELRKVQERWL